MSYLLDTNVCIALINGISPKVRARSVQATQRGAALVTSSIVAHELWYGVAKSERVAQNANRLAAFLDRAVKVLDYSAKDAQAAGEIRAELERQGQRIGEYDTIVIPWGAQHMPGLEAALRERGFQIQSQRMLPIARYQTIIDRILNRSSSAQSGTSLWVRQKMWIG